MKLKRLFLVALVVMLACTSALATESLTPAQESVETVRDMAGKNVIGTVTVKDLSGLCCWVRMKPDGKATGIGLVLSNMQFDYIGSARGKDAEWYQIVLPCGQIGYIKETLLASYSFGDFSTESCSYVIGKAKVKSRTCGYKSPYAQNEETAMRWLSKGETLSVVGEMGGCIVVMDSKTTNLMLVDSSALSVEYVSQ